MSSWQGNLSQDEQFAMLLGLAYEKERNKTQAHYKIFDVSKDPRSLPAFKALMTVSTWFAASDMRISGSRVSWVGYLAYVFSTLAPTVPQIGQLKNDRLYRTYFSSVCTTPNVQTKAEIDLESLYKKIIAPEFADDVGLLELLGLRNIRFKKRMGS